jgi:hypothetical protein
MVDELAHLRERKAHDLRRRDAERDIVLGYVAVGGDGPGPSGKYTVATEGEPGTTLQC